MASADPGPVPLADGIIDLQREQVHRGGMVAALTTREAALIAYLAARPGVPVTRQTLQIEVWGYHGSVVSRTVDTTVRRVRRKIEVEPSRPAHLLTVHGVGYRFEPARSDGSSPVLPGLIGRVEELGQIADRIAQNRLVTLVGGPGIGKSRLAGEVARRWEGPVYSCDLAGVADRFELMAVVADRVGVTLEGRGPSRIEALLASHPGLWLFDDADRAVPALAAQIRGWLQAAPAIRVLVTSCARLKVPGEVVFEVGPPTLEDAMALLARRAEMAGAQWHDPRLLRAICEGLDRIPLALELAAGRARVLGAEDLLARLDQPLRALGEAGGRTNALGSLRSALQGATTGLTEAERATLAQCAVFPSTFSVDAVEAVVQLPSGADALDALAALRDRSLVQARRGDFGLRLWLLRPVRAFALEGLDDLAAVRSRLRRWLLSVAGDWVADLDGPTAIEARSKLAIERLALVEAARGGTGGAAARLAEILDALFALQGPAESRLATLDAVLSRDDLIDADRSGLLRRRGEAHRTLGDLDAAVADLAAAEALGASGPRLQLAWVFVHLTRGDRAAAEERIGQVRPETVVDRVLCAIAAALVHRGRGRRPEAEAELLRALELVRAHSMVRLEGVVLSNLANLRRAAGQLQVAEDLIRQAVGVHRGLGQVAQEAGALHNLAGLLAEGDDLPRALRRAQGAMRAANRAGEATVVAHAQHLVAHLLHRLGQHEAAEQAYVEALGRLRRLNPHLAASALGDLAALQADGGRLDLARGTFDQAEAELATGPDRYRAILAVQRAHLDLACGDRDRAMARIEAADPVVCRMPLLLLERVLAGAGAEGIRRGSMSEHP